MSTAGGRAVFKLDDQGRVEETAMELLMPFDKFFMRESDGRLVGGGMWPTRCLWLVLRYPTRRRVSSGQPEYLGIESL